MNVDAIYNILSNDAFISVNKSIAKKIGLVPAVILAELISEQKYWTNRKILDENGFFFSTIENIENNSGIKRSQQDRAIEELIEAGLIYKVSKGMPRKRFFKINMQKVLTLLMDTSDLFTEKESVEADLTKVRKDVKIFVETFRNAYPKIDKDAFQFLHLRDNYIITKQDIEAVSKRDSNELEKIRKTFEDINYTIEHSGAFDYWKEDMVLSLRFIFKVNFRLSALIKFSEAMYGENKT